MDDSRRNPSPVSEDDESIEEISTPAADVLSKAKKLDAISASIKQRASALSAKYINIPRIRMAMNKWAEINGVNPMTFTLSSRAMDLITNADMSMSKIEMAEWTLRLVDAKMSSDGRSVAWMPARVDEGPVVYYVHVYGGSRVVLMDFNEGNICLTEFDFSEEKDLLGRPIGNISAKSFDDINTKNFENTQAGPSLHWNTFKVVKRWQAQTETDAQKPPMDILQEMSEIFAPRI